MFGVLSALTFTYAAEAKKKGLLAKNAFARKTLVVKKDKCAAFWSGQHHALCLTSRCISRTALVPEIV